MLFLSILLFDHKKMLLQSRTCLCQKRMKDKDDYDGIAEDKHYKLLDMPYYKEKPKENFTQVFFFQKMERAFVMPEEVYDMVSCLLYCSTALEGT